jgi:hypothetical protein
MFEVGVKHAMAQLTAPTLNGHNSSETGLDPVANFWAPPIAATEPAPAADSFLREEACDATARDEHFFEPYDASDLHQILRRSELQRKLIAGSAFVAALAVGVLVYALCPATSEQNETQAAEVTPMAQSLPVAPVEAAPRESERPSLEPTAVAWPDLPPSGTVGAFTQIATAAPAANAVVRQTALTSQNREIVWVQRPRVNIRSAPSTTGTVLGNAPKGKRFRVTKRDGDWVQVESDPVGWIKSEFLGPTKPE